MHRESLPLWKISPWLAKATVAVEDRRFYHHGGLDYLGIPRAAIADAKAGRIVEGGSTIEQELARNLYIGTSEKTLGRKLKEACLATQISDRWSKQKILAAYLNEVYYGEHANGAEAAAQTFFSRSARHLGLVRRGAPRGTPAVADHLRPARATRTAPARGATSCCWRSATQATSRRRPTARRSDGRSTCTRAALHARSSTRPSRPTSSRC